MTGFSNFFNVPDGESQTTVSFKPTKATSQSSVKLGKTSCSLSPAWTFCPSHYFKYVVNICQTSLNVTKNPCFVLWALTCVLASFEYLSMMCLDFWQTKSSTSPVLDSLVSGEEIEVQVSVKTASNSQGGHWSSWSHPVRAVVPQTAGVGITEHHLQH